MTFQEIKEKFKELNISNEQFAWGDFPKDICGKMETVYQKGGEGEGDNWEIVRYFIDHDVYISMSGFYSSYNGTNFTGYELTEVKPQTRNIVIYE